MVRLVSRRRLGPAFPTRRRRQGVVLLDDLRPVDALKDLFVHLMLFNIRQPEDTPKNRFAHRLHENHLVTQIFLPGFVDHRNASTRWGLPLPG